MNILCVDDEPVALGLVVSMCEELPCAPAVTGFTRPREALDWLAANHADIVLLDINMPDMNGLDMARTIKRDHPGTPVVFVTGHAEHAVDAFALHVSGYVLKPIGHERLQAEVEYALSGTPSKRSARVEVRTFGNFDVLVDGRPISFARSQAKELLAYLVDKRGTGTSRREAFAALWERGNYDRSMQKQLDAVIRSMRGTLAENGAGDIVEMERGVLRVVPERIDCDLYRFIDGDAQAMKSFFGEYMSSYSWASSTEGYLAHMKDAESWQTRR